MLKSFRWLSGAVKVLALTEDMYRQMLGKFSGIFAASTRRVTVSYYLSNPLAFPASLEVLILASRCSSLHWSGIKLPEGVKTSESTR